MSKIGWFTLLSLFQCEALGELRKIVSVLVRKLNGNLEVTEMSYLLGISRKCYKKINMILSMSKKTIYQHYQQCKEKPSQNVEYHVLSLNRKFIAILSRKIKSEIITTTPNKFRLNWGAIADLYSTEPRLKLNN